MKFKKWFVPVLFTLVMILIIWLSVSNRSPVNIQGGTAGATQWETGWQAEDQNGALRAFAFPQRLGKWESSIINTLPDALPSAYSVYLKTDYQQVTAEVAGQPVPVNGIAPEAGAANTLWSSIAVSKDMAGKPLRLSFSGMGSKPFIEVYSIRLGTVSAIRLALLSDSLPSIVLGMLILLLAFSLLAFALVETRRYQTHISDGYFHLIALILLTSIWFVTSSDIASVHNTGRLFPHISILSFLLVPVPCCLFIGFMRPSIRRASYLFGGLMALVSLLDFAFSLARPSVPRLGLAVSHALLGVSCITLLILSLSKKRSQRISDLLRFGIVITAAAGVISLVLFYLLPLAENCALFRYAVIALVLVLSRSLMQTNVRIAAEAEQAEQRRVQEEEYRIAVRQSDKNVLRFDVKECKLINGETDSSLFTAGQELTDVPDSMITAGTVAAESLADFRDFFNLITQGRPAGSCVVNLRNRDGDHAWYRIDFTMIYANDGSPLQAIVSFYDVSEQRQKELAYQKWKQGYADIPSAGMSFYEYDLTHDLPLHEAGELMPPIPVNEKRALHSAMDYLAQHYILQNDRQHFLAFFNRDRLLKAFSQGLREDKTVFRRTGETLQEYWTVADVQLIASPYSGNVLVSLLLQDEDEAKRIELKRLSPADNDSLTGLLSRAAFEARVTQLFEKTAPGVMHALLKINLDGFKQINEIFGRPFGDRVLADIGKGLLAMMHADDLIGRAGDNEFAVCLKNMHGRSGFLEKRSAFICQALNMKFSNDVSISGNIGIALYPLDGRTYTTLYQKANQAMRYAQQNGKNSYVFFRDNWINDMDEPPLAANSPESTDAVRLSMQKARPVVLAVDNDANQLARLDAIINVDYSVLRANSGEDCLALLRAADTPVSAVLLRLSMAGGMTGLEVLTTMQNDPALASVPVIAVSSSSETDLSIKAVELGATDFVCLPFNPRVVKMRVRNAIHKIESEELRAQNRYLMVQKREETRHQNELRYIAEHDPLTHICNKNTFYSKTRGMLDRMPDTTFVMIAIDIEKFRLVNDIFGHEEGNRLLRFIAQRIQTLFSEKGTYSRIDADNFALCIPYDPPSMRKLMTDNDRDMKEYDLPFEILLVYGLYIIDDRTLPVSIMHDRAEMAKRTVKGNYLNRFAYYDDNLRKTMLDELEIVNDMNIALQERQFEIYLQPKCRLSTGEIVGAEALVRWNHPVRGVLSPGLFVPIFERNGFIMKMDTYVWEQVCALIRRWMNQYGGKPPIPVSMNVSRVDIYNPALVNTLCRLAERYGVPRRYIELEITENAYAEDPVMLSGLITALRDEGFTVEMDDFGSAYSSLNMLKEIDVDMLKLDMRFLYGSDQDGRGGTILSSVVRMARYLDLPIVAEGVETIEQAQFLASVGCALGQGYLFYRPMPVSEFESLLLSQPLKPIFGAPNTNPESSVCRVWSIDGDFNLMLSTIPCAASLCEFSGDQIEILRTNQEYLEITGDRPERIYKSGTDVRALTTEEEYRKLLTLFKTAYKNRGFAQGEYRRFAENGTEKRYSIKLKYLSGDTVRSLYFITYWPLCEAEASAQAKPAKGLRPAHEIPWLQKKNRKTP